MSAMAEEVSSWVVTEFAEIVFFSFRCARLNLNDEHPRQ
jgi:hypothetical protein